MKVLIIEDEKLAVDGLKIQLQKFDPSIEVLADFDTIEDTVSFLKGGPPVDLAFFDIQLADGLSFEIFEQVEISFPIIFTTAYDEYALKAFEVNSIDYLLKSIGQEGLGRAFGKLESRRAKEAPARLDIEALRQALLGEPKSFKERFMVKVGSKLASYSTEEILYFFGENKIVWLVNKDGRKYPVDYKLEDLQDMLNPKNFYRLNRTFIATHDAIEQVTTYSNNRLKIRLQHCSHDDIFVSRDKAESFRIWLGK